MENMMNVFFKIIRVMSIVCLLTIAQLVYTSSAAYTLVCSSYDLGNTTFNINISGRYAFYNDIPHSYAPIDVNSSSPMVKITASDVTVDFNNIGLANTNNSRSGWTGIEIGWTPAELAADPTRLQPRNIQLCNLSLHNFDCGIIIHEGVHLSKIDNVSIYDVSVGIAMLGTQTLPVHDIKITNSNITGHCQNYRAALVNLKTIIETTYGYGADYFMKLQADTLNSNTLDVYTYFGIWAKYVTQSAFDMVSVDEIGYCDFATSSEGNGNRTQAIGVCLHNSKCIELRDVSVTESKSELKAVGMQLDGVEQLNVKGGDFSYAVSKKRAVGIEVTNDGAATYSCKSIIFNDVAIKNNVSDEVVMGLDFTSVTGFIGRKVWCKLNIGGQQSYGLYTTKMHTVDLRDCKFGSNEATRLTNDVATEKGILAVGIYGENVNSLQMYNVQSGSMKALNSAYGLYLQNSSSCKFEKCDFVANTAVSMRSGEAADIRSQQDAQEISKHAPCVPSTSTGAYGVFCDTCVSIKFETCLANTNVGHRATGLRFQNCRAVVLIDSYASAQQATGLMFDSTLYSDNVATPTSVAIKSVHRPLLFGSLTKTSVNALATTDLFLTKMTAIRSAQMAGATPAYADVIAMIATSSLLQSMVARYRIWGTAIGVHCHNVSGLLMQNTVCAGQVSVFDSGMGICCTGRNTDLTFDSCECLFNVGGYVSIVTAATSPTATYAYTYNLVGMKLFWEMLTNSLTTPFPVAATIDAVGISSTATTFSAQGNKTFGDGTTGDDVYVKLNGTDHRVMVSPIGPIGAALVIGDLTLEGIAKNCNFYGGLGNAGHAYGVLLDNAFSVTLENNTIAGNISNVYGLSAGILDVTAHSTNLFMKNFLEGNKCSIYNNSNYFVPFNAADINGLAFPVTKMMNGKFTNVTTLNDNIVMEYSQAPQFYSIEYLASIPQHPDLISYLTTNSCWA
jgi:hypothetical protein